MRWWYILCASVLWRTATAKAVREIDNVSEASSTRQCCPCPEPGQPGRSSNPDQGFGSGLRSLAYSDQEPFGTSPGARAFLADVDDCPCRPRDADSTGSPSMFFPTAMRAIRPFVSLNDEKEESKPLLHPEVNLASSVLETLRQATDEEYEDALARDAARSVARAMEPDDIIQGVRSLIPVLVSPQQKHNDDDGEIAEASNMQETRYVHPLLRKTKSDRSPSFKTPKLLTDILKKPSRKATFNKLDMDSDVGASNVNENVVPISQARFNKPKKDNLNILPQDNILKNNRLSIPKLSDVLKNIEDRLAAKSRLSHNSDDVKVGSRKVISNIYDPLSIINTGGNTHNNNEEVVNSDNTNAPSNLKENYSRFDDRRNINTEKSVKLENNNKYNDVMSTLNNIKKKLHAIKIPELKLKPENRDSASDLLTEIIKNLEDSRNSLPLNIFNTHSKTTPVESSNNVNKDVKDIVLVQNDAKAFSTEIVDTVSSSTDSNVSAIECLTNAKDANKNIEIVKLDPNIKTDVIDTIPSTSNVHEVIDTNPEAIELNEEDSGEEPVINDNTSNGRFFNSDSNSKETNDINNDFEEIMDNDDHQLERENCSEDEDVARAVTNASNVVIPTQSEDESIADAKVSENIKHPVMSHQLKSIDGDGSCETSENLKVENNDAVPRNGNHSPITSKTAIENEPKSIDDDENCESSENLKDKGIKLLPRKENLLKRLKNLKKSQKSTSDEKQNQLSIDDLQKMSNSLLDKEKLLIRALAERNNKITNTDSNQSQDTPATNGENLERNLEAKDASVAETENVNQITSKFENKCVSDGSPVENREVFGESKKINEMVSEASETVGSAFKPDSISRSSLLPNILEPSSLFDGSTNLFKLPAVSLSDIFRNSLPPLSIPNIFGEMNNDVNRNNFRSNEAAFTKKDSGMSSLASTSNSRSILAPLPPLEDLNIDILQFKPLGFGQSSSLPTLPRLNLNSYKTKLAIPKSLPLKPVFLESSVSNKKGMIGASMSFGKEKNGVIPKFTSKNTAFDIFGNPIALPSFDDLQENFLENAQNLLSTPLETTGRNLIEDTFRSGQVLTENLKVQAKNVVNKFQKTLKSSQGFGTSRILGNTFRSSDILDHISRKHEDIGDKLKGIQHDFSDRLETLRNNILDQIPSLESQIARQSSGLKAMKQPVRGSSRVNKNKDTTTRSRNLKKTEKAAKPKSLNMLSSPSIISPKFAASPKSNTDSPELANLRLSPKDTNAVPPFSLRSQPLLDVFHKPSSKHSSSLRNSFLTPKFKENKVKITFETTPRPEAYLSSIKSKPKEKTLFPAQSTSKALPLKSVYDTNDLPSKMKAVHAKGKIPMRSGSKPELKVAPIALKSKPTTTPTRKNSVLNKSLEPASLRALDEEKRKTSERPLIGDKAFKTGKLSLKSPSWPRIVDETFLTNVREALKARLTGLGTGKHRPTSKLSKIAEPVSSDLARSASNAVEVVAPISESLKENTSYSCQMVCTKN